MINSVYQLMVKDINNLLKYWRLRLGRIRTKGPVLLAGNSPLIFKGKFMSLMVIIVSLQGRLRMNSLSYIMRSYIIISLGTVLF